MGFCCFASLVSMGSPAASAPAGATWRSVHSTAGVLDRLVDRQDETSCFWRRRQGVDPHYGRLPHAGDKVVCDVLVVDVHTVPHAPLTGDRWSAHSHLHFKYYQGLKGMCVFVFYLCVFRPQFVQDVCGVEAGVVAQLSGDDLQGLGVCSNQELLFSGDGPRVVPQVLGQLHLYGSSTRYNRVILGRGLIQLRHWKSKYTNDSGEQR